MRPVVAVVDIGSNSIKVLVATRSDSGNIRTLATRAIDARISAGINRTEPRLSADGMARGLVATRELLAGVGAYAPDRILLVATSAVRDAVNGPEFGALVARETGHKIRVLTGEEEAAGIGHGLTCEPALAALQDFYVFDLGGGSLECLAFRGRRVEQSLSLQLGCVRLTEKFVPDASAAFPAVACNQIQQHAKAALSAFRFALPAASVGVGTGGTVASIRSIRAAAVGCKAEETSPLVPLSELRDLLGRLAPLTLAERRQVSGLSAARADVFPTALATLLAIAEQGGLGAFQHSFYNLRYGLAAELLDELA